MNEHQEPVGESSPQAAPGSTPGSPPGSAPGSRKDAGRPGFRHVAAAICAVEAAALLGLCAFYLWEIAQGGSNDAVRAAMSAVLIAIFAVALGLLARAWVRGAGWPNTPTVVWNLLLLPVGWSLLTGGRTAIGAVVAVVGAVGVVAAVGAGSGASEPSSR